MDYEHIPFRCRKYHEHGHLYQDCPKNKTPIVLTTATDEDSFRKVTEKRKQRRKNPSVSKFSNPSTRNIFGVLESLLEEPYPVTSNAHKDPKRPHQENKKGKNIEDPIQTAIPIPTMPTHAGLEEE